MNTQTPTLPESDRHAIATICLMAAFADGDRTQAEHERIRSVFESMAADDAAMPAIYKRVVMRKVSVADAAQGLTTAESRTLAYEMAVLVCEADDALCDHEKTFLAELAKHVKPDAVSMREAHDHADELLALDLDSPVASAPVSAPTIATTGAGALGAGALGAGALGAGALSAGALGAGALASRAASGASLNAPTRAPAPNAPLGVPATNPDPFILKSSIIAAALELLPQGLASAAIIPVQMNMVYRVGKAHGITLDRGHIKDLLATVGVGVTSQVVEGYARKALTGLLGSAAKKMGMGSLGNIAKGAIKHGTGPVITFATTYALGQVAKQYYAGGRKFSSIDLKSLFDRECTRARSLYEQHAPAIQQQASTLNLSSLRSLVTSA